MSPLSGVALLLLSLISVSYGGDHSGKVASLAVSPDGSLIAAAIEKGAESFIYMIPVKTGNATRLTKNKSGEESVPAFSADGKQIIFDYWPQGQSHPQILLANVDGSEMKPLTSGQFNDLSPVLLPDGKTIIFSRSGYFGSYSPIAKPHFHAFRIYASDLDRTNLRQVANESFYTVSQVSVSPDGRHILLVTEGWDEDGQHITVYSVDQPGLPTLSVQPHVPKSDRRDPIYECPNYLPDGKHILFMSPSEAFKYSYDVYELDLTTGSLERLTKGNGYATDLKVSADGKTGVFLKWHSDKSQIYLLEIERRKLTPLKVSGLN